MMQDLFSSHIRFTPVPLEEADVSFLVRFPFPMADQDVFEKLRRDTPWVHEEVVVWGKKHLQPRLTAWYGDPGRSYTYSGTVTVHPIPKRAGTVVTNYGDRITVRFTELRWELR